VTDFAKSSPIWAHVVQAIQQRAPGGSEDSIEELYRAVTTSVRGALSRAIEVQSVEDRLHEVLVIVLEAIQNGEVRDPDRLMGFVRTVARRRAIAHIRGAALQRQRFVRTDFSELRIPSEQEPETRAARQEQIERARTVLRTLGVRDRQILERFYFDEQPPGQICREMGLTPTQFRLYKSRAVARCFDRVSRPR
jgi:RNA polymerase sigma-70 factor (ECF subfamily)